MKIRSLIILISFLLVTINLLGQIDCGNIDESALVAHDDSVRPTKMEIYKVSESLNDKYDTQSLLTILEKVNSEIKLLTNNERLELDNRIITGCIVGDTAYISDCYEPDYMLKIYYKDGYYGFVGIDSKCKSLRNYKTRYSKLVFSGMLYLYFDELIVKYRLK